MPGTVEPYIRQVKFISRAAFDPTDSKRLLQIVISTGKADWEREVTDVSGSLAAMIKGLVESSKSSSAKSADTTAKKLEHTVPGVFTQRQGTRLSILNGSHTTISEHHERETVLIFPEYRVVFGVENTPKAAELLYEKAVSPSTTYIPTIPEESETGELPFGILPIPYSCVILLCASHLLNPEILDPTHSLSPSRLPQATRQ